MDKKDHKTGIIFLIVFFTVLISLIAGYLAVDSSRHYPSWIETTELTITNLDFTIGDASTGKIIIQVINAGSNDITVYEIKVNNETASSWEATNSATVTKRATETFTVTQEVTAGTKYTVHLFSADGQFVGSYTKTA